MNFFNVFTFATPLCDREALALLNTAFTYLDWSPPASAEHQRQIPSLLHLVSALQGTGEVWGAPSCVPEGKPLHDHTCRRVSMPDVPQGASEPLAKVLQVQPWALHRGRATGAVIPVAVLAAQAD